jgi:hypothetical protein
MSNVEFAGFEDIDGLTDDVMVCRIEFPAAKGKAPKVQRYKLGILSYSEYNEIVLSVLDPVVPTTRFDGEKKVANPDDVKYKAARAAAEEERRLRLLAASLEKGGMVIPGDILGDKAATLAERPANIISALTVAFTQAHHGLGRRLESLAESFLELQPVRPEDPAGVEVDAGGVGRAAAD